MFNLGETLRLETRVKELFFCIGGTSKKRENRNKIEPNSPRDLILGSYPLPQTSLSVLEGIRVLPKIGQNIPKKTSKFGSERHTFSCPVRYRIQKLSK